MPQRDPGVVEVARHLAADLVASSLSKPIDLKVGPHALVTVDRTLWGDWDVPGAIPRVAGEALLRRRGVDHQDVESAGSRVFRLLQHPAFDVLVALAALATSDVPR